MKKFYLYFFSVFLISSFAKSDVVGDWEYFGKNSYDDKYYFNTYVEAKDIRIFDAGGVGDVIASNLLIEYSDFLNNGKIRFNYKIIKFTVTCHNLYVNYNAEYFYNKNVKPYFHNLAIDTKIINPTNHAWGFKPVPNYENKFEQLCNEFYQGQARFIQDDGTIETQTETRKKILEYREKFAKKSDE